METGQANLYDGVHMRQEVGCSDFQQHDQGTANVLAYLQVLIRRHPKQTLQEGRKREKAYEGHGSKTNRHLLNENS